ncbi:MAG TPA: hypothetical protein VFU69_13570, partial [Ktedonobacterales bacterium]|nr:hypothetical protein [Ktedonobacterales bacterium]
MPQNTTRPAQPHPDEWQRDLNPEFLAGENYGLTGFPSEMIPASEIKTLSTERLRDFTMDDLRQIPVLPEGSRLEQGA